MLRFEVFCGPFASCVELNTQKIARLAIEAIPNNPRQFSIPASNHDRGFLGRRMLGLNAGSGLGDIFQIHDFAPIVPRFVPPLRFHQVRAKEAIFCSLLTHAVHIGHFRRYVQAIGGVGVLLLPEGIKNAPNGSLERTVMEPEFSLPPPPQTPTETKLSLALRLIFFIGAGFVGLQIIPFLLAPLFGLVVSATLGLFIIAALANVVTMRIFDRRSLTDIGLGSDAGVGQNFAWGLLLGAGAATLLLVAPLAAGAAHLQARHDAVFSLSSLIFYLVVLLFGAAGEEMLFRGYAFQLLIEKIGPWATVLPVGVLFGFAHAGNPQVTPLALANTMLWGVFFGYAFLRSHDLWLPIGLHYGWNAILPLFGVNLSGLTIEITRYSYQWDLGPLWSGGAYGPEGGILTTIFVSTLFFVLYRVPIVPQKAVIATVLNGES
jgi:membrane protease YdiL (CAAX protease family)